MLGRRPRCTISAKGGPVSSSRGHRETESRYVGCPLSSSRGDRSGGTEDRRTPACSRLRDREPADRAWRIELHGVRVLLRPRPARAHVASRGRRIVRLLREARRPAPDSSTRCGVDPCSRSTTRCPDRSRSGPLRDRDLPRDRGVPNARADLRVEAREAPSRRALSHASLRLRAPAVSARARPSRERIANPGLLASGLPRTSPRLAPRRRAAVRSRHGGLPCSFRFRARRR